MLEDISKLVLISPCSSSSSVSSQVHCARLPSPLLARSTGVGLCCAHDEEHSPHQLLRCKRKMFLQKRLPTSVLLLLRTFRRLSISDLMYMPEKWEQLQRKSMRQLKYNSKLK